VTCIDDREQWLECLRDHPNLRKIATADHASAVDRLPADCYFILMTQGHKTDFPILLRVLSTRSPVYVGVIGSAQKANVLKRELAEQGIGSEKLGGFFCPIGLEIGTNVPVEIAFSVVAQLLAVRTLQLNKLSKT
jgi:xanthine dehydrogenase accessory factor